LSVLSRRTSALYILTNLLSGSIELIRNVSLYHLTLVTFVFNAIPSL